MQGASADERGAFDHQQPWLLLGLALATAGLQIAIASSWEGRGEHLCALAIGWCGALWHAYVFRDRSQRGSDTVLASVLGGGLWAAACLVAVSGRAAYQTVGRFLPLIAGVGLATMSSGLRRLPKFRREFALLGLTLIYPLPFALQRIVMPTPLTAMAAALLLRLMGFPVGRDGTLLQLPTATLRVYDLCSGMVLMTQLLVLAVLVLCFFPTTPRRAALTGITAIVVGFLVNAARISFLAVVASRMPSEFEYWEQYVTGSVFFPFVAMALAGGVWWLVLRRSVPTSSAATDAVA